MDYIYRFAEKMYGINLADYLLGNVSPQQTSNLFYPIGFISLGIVVLIAIIFYFCLTPRFARKWIWFITMVVCFVANLLFARWFTASDLLAGKMVAVDPSSNETISLGITQTNCWMFGLWNGILMIIVFFIFSLILKNWSKNAKYIPFKVLKSNK